MKASLNENEGESEWKRMREAMAWQQDSPESIDKQADKSSVKAWRILFDFLTKPIRIAHSSNLKALQNQACFLGSGNNIDTHFQFQTFANAGVSCPLSLTVEP